MNVGVCYAQADRQIWLRLDVPEGSTISEAIELSGILNQYPNLLAYVERGEARPAFKRAFEAQLAVFNASK